jgi:hypothetical protein
MSDVNNREILVRAKLVDTEKLMVKGDIILEAGGTIRSSSDGDIELNPQGSGNIELNPDGTGVVNITKLGAIANAAGTLDLTRSIHRTVGAPGVAWIDLAGNIVSTETITIDGLVFEFKATPPVNPAHVQVDITPGLTPALVMPVLVATINAQAGCAARAVDSGQATLLLIGKTTVQFTLAEATTNYVVSAAHSHGEQTAGARQLFMGTYTVTAADATVLGDANGSIIVGSVFDGIPRWAFRSRCSPRRRTSSSLVVASSASGSPTRRAPRTWATPT